MVFKKAFSMVELILVIIIISVLSALAIPKFAVNRDKAIIVKASSTLASVRSAINIERNKRILRGNFIPITNLGNIFTEFDDISTSPVLEYPITKCTTVGSTSCWKKKDNNYIFVFPLTETAVFKLENNRLDCDISVPAPNENNCKRLTN